MNVSENSQTREPSTSMFEQATNLGIEYAQAELVDGRTEPREAPLSGEWAGDTVPRDVAWSVAWYIDETTYPMKDQAYFDGEQELADAWERGYNDQWHIQQEHLREASSIAEIWNSNKETTT